MSNRKLSEFPNFVGKELLMKAEKRGSEIAKPFGLNHIPDILIIGLASLLEEQQIL